MDIDLSPREARVLGCLIEKQITTPEQYPLSLNAIVNACNQKSNRDPIMELAEPDVQAAIDSLSRKHLLLERSGFGSRVPKYQQRFCNTEFSVFQFTPPERAILCELLLRGAQTAGELRNRAARMASFADVEELETVLEALAQREGGPLLLRLAREPGRREARYQHLFSAPVQGVAVTAAALPASTGQASASSEERLTLLERQVSALREEIDSLKRRD